MDERKRASKLKKTLGLSVLSSFIIFTIYAAYTYVTLPSIENPHSCFTTKMYKVYLCHKDKTYVRYSQIPKIFIRSLILSEDASFFVHKGLDWHEIKESFRRNFKEWRFARGGSTLTQQLAKNLYLNQRKTIARKIQEFFIAKRLEEKLKKGQILEKYVNVVEFGKDIYGLHKASHHYFEKHPSQLNLIESVYLVSLLPSPIRLGKSHDLKTLNKSNLWRMKIILGRLYRSGKITEEVYEYAKNTLKEFPWPFPHYREEESYLGENYQDEEELFEDGKESEGTEDLDSNKVVEEEVGSLDETDGSLFGPRDEPEEEDTETIESSPQEEMETDSMESEDAESPEN